jgi:aryl-alcohol dehydrogenase-like predicted oxidoreductase
MVHWPIHPYAVKFFTSDESVIQNPPGTAEAFYALEKLKKQGKIGHIGVSNYGLKRLQEIPGDILIAANQLPYSLLSRAIEIEIRDVCMGKGIGIIAYMALMQGILTGKYKSIEEIPNLRRRTRHFASSRTPECRHGEPGFEEQTSHALDGIRRVSEQSGIPMNVLAIRWALTDPAITCTLIGARNQDQVEDNVHLTDPLPADIIDELNDVTRPLKEKLGNHIDLFESAENDRTN